MDLGELGMDLGDLALDLAVDLNALGRDLGDLAMNLASRVWSPWERICCLGVDLDALGMDLDQMGTDSDWYGRFGAAFLVFPGLRNKALCPPGHL